ncbi:MAG: sulfite exporter TauE/SafE family protein [Acidobacteriota bacterium]|nr:sulfite exporter TauE/SafE family protein [Acidobacteriota bacterium]
MSALLATAFLIGLAGGVHCVAMCGGIVSALNLRTGPLPSHADGSFAAFTRQLGYSLGRVTSYALAGALAGGAGGMGLLFQNVLPAQVVLLVVANGLIVLLGLYLAGIGTAVLSLERAGSFVFATLKRLGARLTPASTGARAVGVGLAWGFLPCGLVYSVLAMALVSGSAPRGAAVMAAFGLGTLPNLLVAGALVHRLQSFMRVPRTRLLAGLAVVVLGLVGLARIPGLPDQIRNGLHCLH